MRENNRSLALLIAATVGMIVACGWFWLADAALSYGVNFPASWNLAAYISCPPIRVFGLNFWPVVLGNAFFYFAGAWMVRAFFLGKRPVSRIAQSVLLLAFVVSLAFAARAQNESKVAAREELNQGVVAYRDTNYEGAIEHFSRAVRLDPDSTTAHLYLATAYAQMFVLGVDTSENVVWATRALSEYAEVLQRDPSNVVSLKGIAYLEIQLKNFDRAKESYKKAIAVDPNDPELFYSVGVADWSMAHRAIMAEKAKLDAESGDALFLQPACADARTEALANIEEGLTMLTKAISLRKDYDDAMAYMNLLYRLRADLECGNKQAHAADLKKANDWTDLAMAARKKKAAAATKSNQDAVTDAPPR